MLCALAGGKPDRLPITIHQWQPIQLQRLGGLSQVEAFRAHGLDAAVCCWDALHVSKTDAWKASIVELSPQEVRHVVETPSGYLTWVTATNDETTFRTEHPVKSLADAEAFLAHYPPMRVDRELVQAWRDETGDLGIVRGFVGLFGQSGPWQDFCELVGTQEAIYWAMDEPDEVHYVLRGLTDYKLKHIEQDMAGVPYDLVETGGGASSSTVISPAMHAEFCLPYDLEIHNALRAFGFRSVYHTCGGMKGILKLIRENGADASETLSPPGVGGDILPEDRSAVKAALQPLALIGGIDQHHLIELGSPDAIAADVRHCFETFGKYGGYICSASDHFFNAPSRNLAALAQAAEPCIYG